MRTFCLLASVALFLSASWASAGSAKDHPVSACIVNWRGEIVNDDEGHVGNVRVTFADGHRERWTRRGRSRLARVSKTGLVGWTCAEGQNLTATHPWMNGELILLRDGKRIAKFRSEYAFIEVWGFTDHDTCVVIRSRMLHGPSRIEKLEIKTGERLGGCSGSDPNQIEPWARPFADEPSSGQPHLTITMDSVTGHGGNGDVIFSARVLGEKRKFGRRDGRVIIYDGDYVKGPIPIEVSGRDAAGHRFTGRTLWMHIDPDQLTGKAKITLTREAEAPANSPTPAAEKESP
jgi:hypothetical protein